MYTSWPWCAAVETELEAVVAKICNSSSLRRSPRLQRFLTYIVDQACSGRAASIKEYSIAVAVYDKAASFDPQLDPIVRVEAGRLRSRLLEYYAGPGRDDAIIIELPKGAYLPVIRDPRSAPPRTTPESLAIIPLRRDSDRELSYLVEGISEALTIRLARAGMHVAPWSFVLATITDHADLAATANMLGVKTLLVLSAKANDAAFDVHAEWLDPGSKTHLWGKRYNRLRDDLLSIELDIFDEISGRMAPSLPVQRVGSDRKPHTTVAPAYQLYLKGRYLWNKRTSDALIRAIRNYRQALDLDPLFALALAGMADAYLTLGTFLFLSPQESFPRAKESALRALQIDPNLAEALTTLACARAIYDCEWSDADCQFRAAIAMDPHYAVARQWYGFCLCATGNFDAGQQQLRDALALDPLSPMIETQMAAGFYVERRYEDAIRICERVLDTDPYFWAARLFLGLCDDCLGHAADAIAHLRKASEYSGGTPLALSSLIHSLAKAGAKDEAITLLSDLVLRASTGYVPAYCFALISCGLGKNDQAMQRLEEALAEHSPAVALWLKGEPRLDPLRSEPRFQHLLQSMKLA
jgi:tetratricopeptide (TPR) repeat protein